MMQKIQVKVNTMVLRWYSRVTVDLAMLLCVLWCGYSVIDVIVVGCMDSGTTFISRMVDTSLREHSWFHSQFEKNSRVCLLLPVWVSSVRHFEMGFVRRKIQTCMLFRHPFDFLEFSIFHRFHSATT